MSDDIRCDCAQCEQRAAAPHRGAVELDAIILEAFLAIETREWQRRRLRTLRGLAYVPEPALFLYRGSTWVWTTCLSCIVDADEPGLGDLLRYVEAHEAACGGHVLMRLPPWAVGQCVRCLEIFQ